MEKNNSLVKAINKNVRTSPRKLALVCNFIKGKKSIKSGYKKAIITLKKGQSIDLTTGI